MILEFTSSSGQRLQDRLTFFRRKGDPNRMWFEFELDNPALAGSFAAQIQILAKY